MISTLVLIIFGRPRFVHTIKSNFIAFQTANPEICSSLVLIRVLGLAFPPHFVYDFSRKILLMLYSINWQSFIVWSSLLLGIFEDICIVIVCCPVFDVINFEINRSFFFKPFFYITKTSEQKCKYI